MGYSSYTSYFGVMSTAFKKAVLKLASENSDFRRELKAEIKRIAGKLFRFPEGTMTLEEWVRDHAESVEEYRISWEDLMDRAKYNRLDGGRQEEYEAQLKRKAQKPRYRAWSKGKRTYQEIPKNLFLRFKNK